MQSNQTFHTPALLAAALHGTEYPLRVSKAMRDNAKQHGLVIVFGASDDLMEFDGAIYDEVGCYGGGAAKVDAQGVLGDWENVQSNGDKMAIEQWLQRDKSAKTIKAIWAPSENMNWAYQTQIPHVTFDIFRDGAVICRGLVFSLADLSGQ